MANNTSVRRVKSRKKTQIAAITAAAALLTLAACVPTTPPAPAVPSILMSATKAKGFFSLPWPNAVRKTSSGHLDLNNMPGVNLDPIGGNPIPDVPLLPTAVTNAGIAVTDFGTNSAVFFQASVALDPATLPTPTQTTTATSSIALLDLDDNNTPAPVVVDFRAKGDRFRPDNFLAVLPYPGHPLHAGHRYAAVIFDNVHAANGATLQPAPLISQLDDAWSSSKGVSEATWNALRTQRDDVRAATTATGRSASSIVAFTEYRTQDVGDDMTALTATVGSLPKPALDIASQGPCEVDPRASNTLTSKLIGTISMPTFQSGTYPYLFSGGGLVVDHTTQRGVIQKMRPVAFQARIPCGTPPAGGYPIAAHIDGTGGDEQIDSSRPPFDRPGWIVGEIAPGMAHASDPALELLGLDAETQVELLFYNVLNSPAGRGNSVQQAIDHISLLRALENLQLDGATFNSPVPVTTNDSIELITGQSQGAATLPLVADHHPAVTGIISGAGGAGIYHSVSHGFSRRQLFSLLTGDIAAMDELNPLQQLLQTVVEETDGSNYTASHANFLNISGIGDACVTIESARHLDRALGLTVLNQQSPTVLYGAASLEPQTASLPYAPPAGQPLRVDLEHGNTHWGAYDPATASLRAAFATALRTGVTPTVPASPYLTSARNPDSCLPRYDSPTNTFGR